ncbi:MAG: serine/threonine protein kinase [Planctomycetota bacterium]|nr:MAG: serine/threonine protein kinase [Planctomycetota bacterium]
MYSCCMPWSTWSLRKFVRNWESPRPICGCGCIESAWRWLDACRPAWASRRIDMVNIENDRQAVELMSRSLSGDLTSAERDALREYEARHAQAGVLHQWMAAIEHAAQLGAESSAEDEGVGGLSPVSKERMQRAVAKKLEQALSAEIDDAQYAQVAEKETLYYAPPQVAAGEGETTESAASDEQGTQRRCDGRFTLIQKIGSGGLGSVWLARDEVLGRKVALKEMNPTAAASKPLWRRFQREAQITGHLEHPHVVPVYLSGIDSETGLPFYAMRFLGKHTLADAIEEYHARREAGVATKIDLHRLLTAFLNVCEAIAYAHDRGVLHRDLKPQNVALDRFGQVLVLDWGLAKLDSDGELYARLALSGEALDWVSDKRTFHGKYLGTPLYMAPEQAEGDLDAIDVRTDVFGLGAILYSILTGRAPHHQTVGDLRHRQDLHAVLRSIVEVRPPSPRSINPDVPRDLEAICMRALAPNKAARHRTAAELAAEVENWIAGRKERASNYEALRLAGRDLKSRLCVQLRQLASTAKFMTEVPPTEGILETYVPPASLQPDSGPEVAGTSPFPASEPAHGDNTSLREWRGRLAAIMQAAIRNRPNLAELHFLAIEGEHVTEMVRVRRGVQDPHNVRAVPEDQLLEGVSDSFQRAVAEQFPGEPVLRLAHSEVFGPVVQCGVSVVARSDDRRRGMIIAAAELKAILSVEAEMMNLEADLQLFDADRRLVYSLPPKPPATLPTDHTTMDAKRWETIISELDEAGEYIDPAERVYATRLVFPNRSDSITIVISNRR